MIEDIMDCSFETMSGMMLTMGLFGLLATILLLLATVTLVKQAPIFQQARRKTRGEIRC